MSRYDIVLCRGSIHTLDEANSQVDALAIREGVIVDRGGSDDVLRRGGDGAEVIDLEGRMVLPGLIDGHSHPTKGAIAELFTCKFPSDSSPEQMAAAIESFVAEHASPDWIVGGRYRSDFFERHPIPSPRQWLDLRSGGRPIYLREDTGHNGWANSAALERLGIRADSVDPPGGKIHRDPAGQPTGRLDGQADVTARAKLPDWSPEQYAEGVRQMCRIANGYGITGIVDADATEPLLRAYHAEDSEKRLTVQVVASLSTPFGPREVPLDYDHLERLRDRYASDHVDTRFAKIYEDGVPTGARTAAMLEPYEPHPEFPPAFRGELHVAEPLLTEDLAELEARGFTVKLHTAGDRSVRVALNAIEGAHRRSGRSDLRHELAHAGLIAPSDLARFAQLNAVADLSPYLWHPTAVIDSIRLAIGDRADAYWPIRTLLESGAEVMAGSDWPAAVESMDPWPGIEAMVTRRDPTGEHAGTLGASEALSLERVLRIFTVDGARAMRKEDRRGSLAVGKAADLVVLDRNLFEIPPETISQTRVDMTFFEGSLVYQRKGDRGGG